jgi:uncharacterized membrane protein YvlD (DUF360 family)
LISRLADRLDQLVQFYVLQARLLWTWRTGPLGLLKRAVISFVVAFGALGAAIWAVPGIRVTGLLPVAIAVVVLAGLNALVRPVLLALIAPFSLVLVGVFNIIFQVVTILVLGPLVPGLEVDDAWSAFLGALVFAVVHTFFSFVLSLDQDESYYGALVRQLTLRSRDVVRTDRPGAIIVQIDGVAHPVLAHEIRAGRVPHIARLVRSGRMRLSGWEALLPSQTSASQAGILHGDNDGIPAFRWWEKSGQRLRVSNHPDDALEIVRRISNGQGLLSSDGVSIGNLVTGDAIRSYLTMAALADPTQGLGASRGFFAFFLSPHNYVSAIVLALAEAGKEMIQALRQRQRGIEPRLDRGLPYPFMRAATNVVLRSLNTALVIEEMYRGSAVIYVDYTDYDEIAHHSGPERPESLDALDGIDGVLGMLERAAADAPRPYRFIVLSDHGQTLGPTFRQRHGETLAEVIRDAMGGAEGVTSARGRAEGSQLNALLSEAARVGGATGALLRTIFRHRTTDGFVEVGGPAAEEIPAAEGPPELVVCASGNLALVYFPRLAERATLETIEGAFPGLVDRLVNHPGSGLVMVRTEAAGTVAIGRNGRRHLESDRVEGRDPVTVYGGHALDGLRRVDAMRDCGDLVVISRYDPETGEVSAFEEQIGSHGGLGGDQTRPFILYPSDWRIDEALVGAPAVYAQIRRWLEDMGIQLGPAGRAGEEAAGVETAAAS